MDKKNQMRVLDPSIRITNFDEVSLGYSEDEALCEARRCLNCKNPKCVEGCPVSIKIPEFINKIVSKDYQEAYKIIQIDSSLSAICGRVCPQENQCEKNCIKAIKGESVAIGRLERFVSDYCKDIQIKTDIKLNGKSVAIIGSGPSGLACANELVNKGYKVTIYEALHEFGGVLIYGIPEFRLPKDIVKKEIDNLKNKGVSFVNNVVIGKTITIDELIDEYKYDAVYLASGAGLPRFMGIKGENLNGVYSANEFLTRINLMKAYKQDSFTPIKKMNKVAIVGGGNVAMDAARCAIRLGIKEAYVIYRRSMQELPARKEEVEHALDEGIIFKLLNNPIEILSDEQGNCKAIRCIKMQLGEPDESGRRSPTEIKGSEFDIDVDGVIMAIGTSPNPLIADTTKDIEINKRACIVIDEKGRTSKAKVYAGGDAVSGAATVILAMGAGKLAGKTIDEDLNKTI